jgi:hypothetical protein
MYQEIRGEIRIFFENKEECERFEKAFNVATRKQYDTYKQIRTDRCPFEYMMVLTIEQEDDNFYVTMDVDLENKVHYEGKYIPATRYEPPEYPEIVGEIDTSDIYEDIKDCLKCLGFDYVDMDTDLYVHEHYDNDCEYDDRW